MKTKITLGVLAVIFSCLLISCLQKEIESSPSPFGRDEWRSMMRNNNHSPDKVIQARKEVRSKLEKIKKKEKDAGLKKWTSLGPGEVGGRVRAIATHPTNPDILYVGGASGGIWKSNDRGSSWIPKGDLLPSLAVTSIIIHPNNPDTMFLSTGEGVHQGGEIGELERTMPGTGIFRSFDGGNTWDLIPAITPDNMQEFYWVNKIIFNPNDPSKIVAVGHYQDKDGVELEPFGGTLHYLTDFGASVGSDFISLNRGGFIDVEWPAGKDSLIVGTAFGVVVFSYESSNDIIFFNSDRAGLGGLPSISILGRVELSISPNNPNKVYGTSPVCGSIVLARSWLNRSSILCAKGSFLIEEPSCGL